MDRVIAPVRGTRDFFPEQMALRNWLYKSIGDVCKKYGYEEWDSPILEAFELYAAKSGDELVLDQAFVFDDRGGARVALRPELTPSLARMVAQQGQQIPRPIRWWSFGPFWRYERPQKGRTREFFQWNVDFLGCESMVADVEVASVGAALLSVLGISPEQVTIRINSRKMMEQKVSELGIPLGDHAKVFRLIDRLERVAEEEWLNYGIAQGLESGQVCELKAMLDDREEWGQSEELNKFLEISELMGTREWFEIDPTIIRGLDYYTGVVFEARDRQGKFRAIFGGGRYDNLVSEIGGDAIPATGFAMGDVVVELLMRAHDLVPDLESSSAVVLVTVFDEERIATATALACELREAGIPTELYPHPERLAKQFKYAERKRVPVVAVVGPDELDGGEVSLKRLDTREQIRVDRTNAAHAICTVLDDD